MEISSTQSPLYGLVAEFSDVEQIVAAAEKARAAGYRRLEAYSPFPIHGLDEALDLHDWKLPWMIFIAGLIGTCTAYSLQFFTATPTLEPILKQPFITDVIIRNIPYPMNVGGRPFHSWPSFVPVSFELTILFASLTAVFGMILLNGLPRPYHSIFNTPNFQRATLDKFFLCIEANDPRFDIEETAQFLKGLGADVVSEVER